MRHRDISVRTPALARRLIHPLSKLLERAVLVRPYNGTGDAKVNGTSPLAQGVPSPGNELDLRVPPTLQFSPLKHPCLGGSWLRIFNTCLLVLIHWG